MSSDYVPSELLSGMLMDNEILSRRLFRKKMAIIKELTDPKIIDSFLVEYTKKDSSQRQFLLDFLEHIKKQVS